jgi:hypothetical protein
VALLAYLAYEFYFVPHWEAALPPGDPVIRADLFFIYPVLTILLVISVLKLIRKRKT